jgi:peptidoglycan/xylan/chitin deacetylase (PgdA/CDA1 family)
MRIRLAAGIFLLAFAWFARPIAQAPTGADQQPGLKWSDEQIRKTAHHVRAGRKLTPKTWPNGARVAVCISVDPDNFSIALNAGNNAPVPISLGEYGALEGVPRMLKLFDKHNIPVSFYIPAVAAMMHPAMVQEINKRKHHEVAIHGWIHENPMTLDDPVDEWRMISQSLDLLEKQWGRRPVGNRNPSWTMSTHTIGLLSKAGLLYDSSLQAMDEPHEVLLDGQPTGLIELPVNWIIDDSPMYGAAGDFPSPRMIMQTFRDDFDVAYREGTMFMLTMHPHITGQRSRMRQLEELIVYMKSKPGVWFATAEEIAKYIKQQSGLTAMAAPAAAAVDTSRPQSSRPDNQPGRKMTEAQLREASSHVRAGRSLNPKMWPNGARAAVAVTFNVNNSANQLARGDTAVVAMTGGEFGAAQGLARVLSLLDEHEVPSTFFVSAVAAMVDPQMLPEILKRKRHEIGVLGWSDENVVALNDAAEESRLLTRAVDYLTKAAGRKPIGARGPSGAISLHTMPLLKKAGFLYDSTLQARDEPYEVMLQGQASGIVELPVNAYINDYRFLTSARTGPGLLPSPELVFEQFRDDFDIAYQEGTLSVLTLHPHVVGMRSRIIYLDQLIRYMKSKPGVWFATAEQIARYVKQQSGLTN